MVTAERKYPIYVRICICIRAHVQYIHRHQCVYTRGSELRKHLISDHVHWNCTVYIHVYTQKVCIAIDWLIRYVYISSNSQLGLVSLTCKPGLCCCQQFPPDGVVVKLMLLIISHYMLVCSMANHQTIWLTQSWTRGKRLTCPCNQHSCDFCIVCIQWLWWRGYPTTPC